MERRYDNIAVARLCGWGLALLRTGGSVPIAADRADGDDAGAGPRELEILMMKGEAEYRAGRLVQARDTLEEACAMALGQEDSAALGRASTRLCVTLLNLGDASKVLEVWEQTAPHLGMDRRIEAARLRRHAADALRMIGRLEEAVKEAEAAMEQLQAAGAGPGELAGAYHTLGNVAAARGIPAAAVGYYEQGIAALRSVPSLEHDAGLLYSLSASAYNCGVSHVMAGHIEAAADLVQEARRIWAKLGDEHGLATSLSTLGDIALAKGDLEDAEQLCAESAALSERLGDLEGMAMARYHQAGAQAELGRPADALESLTTAATILEEQGLKTVLPSVLASQAKALLAVGDIAGAGTRLAKAESLLLGDEVGPAKIGVLAATAVLNTHARRFEAARDALQRAVELAASEGLRQMEADIKLEVGRAFIAHGQGDEGVRLLGEAGKTYDESGLAWWAERARSHAPK
ncbi:MAG: tetratricopeptide repeat protein, partial [Candidatus Rokuibacteriota bacterium]